jgi:hypothetical protein
MMNTKKRQAADVAKTMLVLTLASLILFFITRLLPWLYVASALAAIGAFSDKLSRVIDWLWMGLARLLGHVVPVVMMGVVFFIVLTPLAWLYRLMGKQRNPLMLRDPGTTTFVELQREYPEDSFRKTW